MEPNPSKPKVPPFLSNLGKATLRGIRKCPHCGTYNGTRGLSCKNKSCGTVFRFGKQPSKDAVKLITGSDVQIFSVRQRDRGSDQRCLVVMGLSETTIQTAEGTIITQISSGRCFSQSCLKATARGVVDTQCQHIKLTMNCQSEAEPLPLKSTVLNAMQIPAKTRQSIWQLANEPSGPLVQRVTKTILVVRCKANQQNNLGYVHVSFTQKPSPPNETGQMFTCSCQPSKTTKGTKTMLESKEKCIHYYACLGAFASDDALAEEFTEYLCHLSGGAKEASECKMETEVQVQEPPAAVFKPKKRKKDEGIGTNSAIQDSTINILRKPAAKKPASTSAVKRQGCNQLMDESQVSLSFQEWLASVTERIHQTMHYQFDGKPEPLVFHIPQSFFDALQQRLSMGSPRKRLPNNTTAFVRKDALPLGTFTKYTWLITNILHVKQIFDTPQMPLEITRSFVQNRDGTYELFKCPKVEVESIAETYGRIEKQPIRPLELKTFMKVGNISAEQKEPIPFTIEWIPDILPVSKIGELRIKFEYGHHRNGPSGDFQEPVPHMEHTLEITPLTTITFD
uniref:Chromosome 2 open reading frame 42 n=1 Tax=Leptobrachium leishanense TaxID=445787 RepID=A0A8C5M2B5_9ANUR